MTTTYTLEFELSTQDLQGARDVSAWDIYCNDAYVGRAASPVPPRNDVDDSNPDDARLWQFNSFVLTTFDPSLPNHISLGYIGTGNTFGGYAVFDYGYIRKLRVYGSDGSIYYGEYPLGFTYGLAVYNASATKNGLTSLYGVGAHPHIWLMGDGDYPPFQFNMQTRDYDEYPVGPDGVSSGVAHLFFSVPTVLPTLTNLHWEIPPAGAYEFGSLQADLTDVPAFPHDSIYARFYNSSGALLVTKILSPLEQRRSDGKMHIYIPGSAVQPNGLAYATAITRLELEDTAGGLTSFNITSRVTPDRGMASVRHTSLSDDTLITVMGARTDAWTDAFDFASLTVRTATGGSLIQFTGPTILADGSAVLTSSTPWPDGQVLGAAALVTLESADGLRYEILNFQPDWVLTTDFAASRVAFSFPNTR